MKELAIPHLYETLLLLPMTILSLFASIPVTIKVLNKNEEPLNALTLSISLIGVVGAALAQLYQTPETSIRAFSDALVFDHMSLYANMTIFLITGLALCLSYSGVNTRGESFAEHAFLILLSAVGMLILTSSNDLIISFIGLELMSIALYVLIGLGHEQQYSKEAAFKYFILGSFASAIYLYGIAFIFGSTGSTFLLSLAKVGVVGSSAPLLSLGIVLLVAGIAFKVSLFPFHAWTPDVYQGAPTSVAAFMATGVKVAMFTVFLRIANLHLMSDQLISILQVVAVLTMIVGNATALVQDNIKRLIAYSSIAHAGYLLIGIIAAAKSSDPDAGTATLFYLLSYAIMNIGAFAVVNIFEKQHRGNLSVTDYAGLGFKYPLLGIGMSVFMLSLAGIPPTAGFLGKFYIFSAAIKEKYVWLAIMGAFNSLLSVYYYLRVLVYLYMKEEVYDVRPDGAPSSVFVILSTIFLTLLMGILSTPFYRPALQSMLALLN